MNLARLIGFILIFATGIATLFIAVHSATTTDVIEQSLSRHVDIFLLERPTYSLVMGELESQNLWLWLSGTALVIVSFVLILPLKKPQQRADDN